MPTSLALFNKDLAAIARNFAPQHARLAQKKLAFDMLSGVVKKTPVDTSRARGNWQLTIGNPAEGEVANADARGAQAVIADGESGLDSLPLFGEVWLTNNVPYIVYLEAGRSNQAPSGMVRLTIEELRTSLR